MGKLWVLIMALVASAAMAGSLETGTVLLADSKQSGCSILVPPEAKICRLSAERLQSYIEKNCGPSPEIRGETVLGKPASGLATIVIGRFDDFQELDRFISQADRLEVKRDGYVLKRILAEGSDYIFALGHTEKGAANAVWRLIREVHAENHTVSVAKLDITASPFIKTRDATIHDPWVRRGLGNGGMDELLYTKYCPRNWTEGKLRTYTDMLDSFGYNEIQVSDLPRLNEIPGGTTESQWEQKVLAMAEQAHRNGQKMVVRFWASATEDPATGKQYWRPGACFHDPYEKQLLLTAYRHYAEVYAAHIDMLITHWSDLGGAIGCEKGCTIETAFEQHNLFTGMFRESNPDIESCFSLWGMKAGAWNKHDPREVWPGYKGISSLIKSKTLPKSTIIAAITWCGKGNQEQIETIHKNGYKPAVWMWRTMDIEHWHGLHVHTRILEDYFRGLSAETGENLEFHTAGHCSHYLTIWNSFMTAQLMWNPQASGHELLQQFARGVFGPENEGKIVSVLDTFEQTGCAFCPGHPPEDIRLILAGAEANLKKIAKAEKIIKQVKIDKEFVPVFPLIMEPDGLVSEIKGSLLLLRAYTEKHIKMLELLKLHDNGASSAELQKAFDELPTVQESEEYLDKNFVDRDFIEKKYLKAELGL